MANQLNSKTQISFRLFLIIGIVGSIITGIGEFLLHYHPNGYQDEISMVEQVPLSRASIGHFMVVFGFPLYFAGYYAIFRILEPAHQKMARAFFVLGVYSFAVGGVWVASRYFIADVLQTTTGTEMHEYFYESYKKHYQNLVWALRVLILLVSGTFIFIVISGKSILPKYMAFFSPIAVLISVFIILALIPAIGIYLAPTAMNVAHIIFFGAVLFQISKTKFA